MVKVIALRFDRRAVEIAAVLLFVAGAAAVITMPAPAAVDTSPEQVVGDVTGSESGNEAATATAWVLIEVFAAVAILALIFISRRLPPWLRTTLKRLGIASAIYYWGVASMNGDQPLVGLVAMAGVYLGYRITDRLGVYWVINNVLSVAIAIAFGVVLGGFLGVVGFAAALVALTGYDYYFADRKSVMFDLADFILRLRIPVIFVRPAGAQLRWGDLLGGDLSDEDDTPGLAWGIGTADLLAGAAFIAALTTTGSFMGVRHSAGVIGLVLAGLALSALRLSHKLETKDGGAGLPAITAGLLLPYAGVVALSLVVGWVV